MKWTEFENVIFLKHKGSVTKIVEVSLDLQWLNKTYYKKIENQKPPPSEFSPLMLEKLIQPFHQN